MPLPVPVESPRELPGVPHAYPYAPEELDALAGLKSGDQFRWRGRHYLATTDAREDTRNGSRHVWLDACRVHPAMPSGWELADIGCSSPIGSAA